MKKKQNYYPSRIADQIPWLENFRSKIAAVAVTLGLPGAKADANIAGCRYLIYVLSQWLPAVRAFGPAATEAIDLLTSGEGASAIVLPAFAAPPLPPAAPPLPAVVAVAPGVLTRLFDFVQEIKDADAYTETIGMDLGIVATDDAAEHSAPRIKLAVLQGTPCECVEITFNKFGHMGVYIECRRNGGAWEFLAIDTESPYGDERPLLDPTKPEIREYRARFWDKGTPNGDWTDVAKVTVAP